MKFLLRFFFVSLLSTFAVAQENVDEDFDIDSEIESEIEAESTIQRRTPQQEAPYGDAEEILIEQEEKKQNQHRRKKRRVIEDDVPLPSAVTELAPIPPSKDKRINKRYLYHPYSRKGLFKITKDGDYLYRVPRTPEKAAIAVRFGFFTAPNLKNSSSTQDFDDLYGSDEPMILFNYEWKKDNWIPNLSLTLGSGLVIATGNGILQEGAKAGEASIEEFLFLMIPINAGLSYKLRFKDTQAFIPFAEAGVSLTGFTERRDDGEPPIGRFGGAAGVYAAGGLALSVTSLDWDSSVRLDAEYGINDVWLTLEARQVVGFTTFDMTATTFNAGVITHF